MAVPAYISDRLRHDGYRFRRREGEIHSRLMVEVAFGASPELGSVRQAAREKFLEGASIDVTVEAECFGALAEPRRWTKRAAAIVIVLVEV